MGVYTAEHPKCMTELTDGQTIISRQLQLLSDAGIRDVIITTGYYNEVLMDYCRSLNLPIRFQFVYNPLYGQTNYIYSIYCARQALKGQDILLLHGDLVFTETALQSILADENSCMKVSSTLPLPEKDFKAVVQDGLVKKVGVEFFESAMEAQALYKLNEPEWTLWLNKIMEFCETDRRKCYAEVALNEITDQCIIHAHDVKDDLCTEIDTPEDWEKVLSLLRK